MFIVDLAGSERLARSGVTGLGAEEAVSINQSLSGLGRVVITLIESSKGFIPYNASPLTMVLKAGLGGNSKTALIACVTQAGDSMGESVNTLRFAMQASHVKNKVEKNSASAQAVSEKARMEAKAHSLELPLGSRETIDLPNSGPVEVIGSWSSAAGIQKPVVLLGSAKVDLLDLAELVEAVAALGHPVIAPLLQSTGSVKELDGNMAMLGELVDWLGVAGAVVYGRDWGGIQATKLKILHSKRVKHVVIEERSQKMDEKAYKAQMKKDPNSAFGFGAFLWFYDGDYANLTSGKEVKLGKNMAGWKGKATFLWPFQNKGRHDPRGKSSWGAKMGNMFAKAVKTEAIDSYHLTEADVAKHIAAGFSVVAKKPAAAK